MPVNRELPAGIASHRYPHAAAKKQPSGLNVARFIAREEELHQARAYTNASDVTASRARWEEKQNLRAGSGARSQQQKQLAEEMELMNKEVQIVRHERLKKYYESCYEEETEDLLNMLSLSGGTKSYARADSRSFEIGTNFETASRLQPSVS